MATPLAELHVSATLPLSHLLTTSTNTTTTSPFTLGAGVSSDPKPKNRTFLIITPSSTLRSKHSNSYKLSLNQRRNNPAAAMAIHKAKPRVQFVDRSKQDGKKTKASAAKNNHVGGNLLREPPSVFDNDTDTDDDVRDNVPTFAKRRIPSPAEMARSGQFKSGLCGVTRSPYASDTIFLLPSPVEDGRVASEQACALPLELKLTHAQVIPPVCVAEADQLSHHLSGNPACNLLDRKSDPWPKWHAKTQSQKELPLFSHEVI
ncbi:hypothetical protein N0V83_005022 [Neocucurbitaria cava]|uniref:Uncharacterized protein n=1 Tax=Neocucurbitaria cava TaxID=798079 RepID=A0A9W8Y7T4_9PLEO|nr:hypothetical protein N0V83_005022 [Neocucurbitaria cava]